MKKDLHFKVNAAIKNIIGKELIYSDNIAIVELIKNAKDAGARKTDVRFFNENRSGVDSKIVIADNGRGMSINDIETKWLNVAFSEKKQFSEDILYAGNKGVGRFSCDRLGSKLTLYTKTKDGPIIKLFIDWSDFEDVDQDEEMSIIPIQCEDISQETFIAENKFFSDKCFDKGTILHISDLRTTWNSNKLKKLISELEKFCPSLDSNFDIYLFSDNNDKEIINKLNRKINNSILSKVSFKTTYIKSNIDKDGKNITTSLFYQGEEVYNYIVKNPFKSLKNISTEIHYIDTIARAYFSKSIGVKLVDYGSIFLFYNNFRISPYGNPKNDWLGIDQRKGQGRARYLGTRELFGRIDIKDVDNTFNVLTNREGLAQNKAFHELIAYDRDDKINISVSGDEDDYFEEESYGYIINIIRQLEAFVVDGLEWNRFFDIKNPDSKKVISDRDLLKDPKRYKLKEISPEKIQLVCERLLKSNWNIKDIKINTDLIKHIFDVAIRKHEDFLKDFLSRLKEKSLSELTPYEKGTAKKLILKEIEKREKAQKERDIAEKKQQIAEKKVVEKNQEIVKKDKTIEEVNSINSFLKRSSNQDIDDLLALMHSILVNTSTIKNNVISLLSVVKLPDSAMEMLADIQEANQKNHNIAKFATLRNFVDKTDKINGELLTFIKEYIKEVSSFPSYKNIKFNLNLSSDVSLNVEFIPLEIMMLLENVITNSKKARAKNITISTKRHLNGNIEVCFEDDGIGITNERYKKDINLIFDKGETTTNGSGIGLYHVHKIATKLSAKIRVNNYQNGFNLGLIFQ